MQDVENVVERRVDEWEEDSAEACADRRRRDLLEKEIELKRLNNEGLETQERVETLKIARAVVEGQNEREVGAVGWGRMGGMVADAGERRIVMLRDSEWE